VLQSLLQCVLQRDGFISLYRGFLPPLVGGMYVAVCCCVLQCVAECVAVCVAERWIQVALSRLASSTCWLYVCCNLMQCVAERVAVCVAVL